MEYRNIGIIVDSVGGEMTLKELMDKASPVPWSEDPEGIVQVEIESAEGLPVGCAYLSENQVDANSPNATLIVHCVNNFALVVEALRSLRQAVVDENASSTPLGEEAERAMAVLVVAQTIPS